MPILRFPDYQVHIKRENSDKISVVFKYDKGQRASIVAFYFSVEEVEQLSRALRVVAATPT